MIATVNFTIEFCYCPNTILVLVVVSSIDNSRQIEPASTVLIAVDLVPPPRLIPVPSLPCPSAGTQTSAYFSDVSKKKKKKTPKKAYHRRWEEGGNPTFIGAPGSFISTATVYVQSSGSLPRSGAATESFIRQALNCASNPAIVISSNRFFSSPTPPPASANCCKSKSPYPPSNGTFGNVLRSKMYLSNGIFLGEIIIRLTFDTLP